MAKQMILHTAENMMSISAPQSKLMHSSVNFGIGFNHILNTKTKQRALDRPIMDEVRYRWIRREVMEANIMARTKSGLLSLDRIPLPEERSKSPDNTIRIKLRKPRPLSWGKILPTRFRKER